jgi:hypothetical protein
MQPRNVASRNACSREVAENFAEAMEKDSESASELSTAQTIEPITEPVLSFFVP